MSEASPHQDTIAPALLVSMPQLNDPNFARTVVLLCQMGPDGAWGLVVNRPTGQAAAPVDADVLERVTVKPAERASRDSALELWYGGPVQPDRGCLLLGAWPDDGEALELLEGLYISGSAAVLRRMLLGPPPPRARLLMGYAGWAPGQLENELTQSAWLITSPDLDIIFETRPEQMWEAAIRRLGADPSLLQMSPGVH
ncbi:MAG: YqgE/AlgH family protein [Acidobacteria bacterium]|nr:YqgE/AlgH family protein [Acidobacteriota bacterium]